MVSSGVGAIVTANAFMNIVFIEDCPSAADMLHMLLNIMGHSVLLAFTGSAGIELALAAEPDVVIIDLGLPDMDGFHVARRLRSVLQPSRCTFIALTGWTDRESRERAREAGIDHFFTKESDVSEFLSFMGELAG